MGWLALDLIGSGEQKMDLRPTNFQVGPDDSDHLLSGLKLLGNLGLKYNNKEKREIQNLDLKNIEINT